MARLGLEKEITDSAAYERTVKQLADAKVLLPRLSELANPATIPDKVKTALAGVDPDEPNPLNLFRVHWYNDSTRRNLVDVPNHVVLDERLTGVASPIIVVYGNRFPMIRAHKVLAAYGCLVPRLVTGQFDMTSHRAVWPSTGNYCRGGVAISRVLGCRGVAVLPEGMSQERFNWLEQWAANPAEDVIRTVGTESNVKEIYDKCAELDADPNNIIFNQFCEFANHLVHYSCTGRAMERVFESVREASGALELSAFVSATGSAGTIAAGDYLKDQYETKIVAAEAVECPTMLYNGFGEHNIQGIGDKHIPFIHNVMNTDVVAGVSDRSCDSLNVLFNTDEGRAYLTGQQDLPAELVSELANFGLSSICNVLAAIKTAKQLDLGANQAVITVATDGAEMYATEIDKAIAKHLGGTFDSSVCDAIYREHMVEQTTEHTMVMSEIDRNRVFNLGYFTWVEQQGVSLEEFEVRRRQDFWRDLRPLLPVWDDMIGELNERTLHERGLAASKL